MAGLGAGQTQADEKQSVEKPKVLLFLGTGRPTVPLVRITVVDQFPIRALYVQVGQRAADKIVFSMTELIGNIWMMENISEKKRYHRP